MPSTIVAAIVAAASMLVPTGVTAQASPPEPTFTEHVIAHHAHAILVMQQAERDAAAEAHRLWHVEQDRLAAAEKVRDESARRAPIRTAVGPTTTSGMPSILVAIRNCESGGSYTAKNPRSSASGAYQFLDSTWTSTTGLAPPARAYSAAQQDAAALKLYRSSGTVPWNASRSCWQG